ncbi:leukemia inhibitory factor receptor [Spea bombifrons]|uniref:leukemia inhibitory factor receptor n=1 Tax=Spea bombifrons TaxID=233779 RepID=UPI002349171E|nr:leukemia inhibitory factor receptor [Spea bombifrons]
MRIELCFCLLVTLFSCFPCSIYSQNIDPSEFFQNLTCLTHDTEYLLCTWDTPLPTDSEVVYHVCYSSSEPQVCFQTNQSLLEIDFKAFGINVIRIKATTDLGPVEITLQKTMHDVPFVPYAPEIVSLTSNYLSDTLYATWHWNTSGCLDGVELKFEIQILRGENLDVVTTESVISVCAQNNTRFPWSWVSDVPLLCTSHSVRVRCFVNEEHYFGDLKWSQWSRMRTVYGSSEVDVMYPDEKVVAVGSNVTFCCIVKEGMTITSIQYNSKGVTPFKLGKNASAIRLKNMSMSIESGDNLFCNTREDAYEAGMGESAYPIGTVVFVGYPPDKLRNFTCETRDLKKINCTWDFGRTTGLYGHRKTIYVLHESISGKNVSCNEEECTWLDFSAIKNQNLYNFSLTASNPLGQSEAFLALNLTEQIYLWPPREFTVRESSPTQVSLSWKLNGRFALLMLLCEIQTNLSNGGTRTRNVTFSGLDDGFYNYSIANLRPFHSYEFRVRCASVDPFWKWGDWSVLKKHHTSPAAPSRKPDIWREVTGGSEQRTITVYWKPFSTNEANGPVRSYKVSWKPLESNAEQKSSLLSALHSRAQINVSGDKEDYEVSVAAINDAGLSPAARITTAELPNDAVEMERQIGSAEGINITWHWDRNVSCGHVVQWTPAFRSHASTLLWNRLPSHRTSAFIHSDQFLAGIRYNISVFGCKENKYQLFKMLTGYTQELSPKIAPNLTVEGTTSNSVRIKWNAVPEDTLQGFLQGYLVYIMKQDNDTSASNFRDLDSGKIMKNITNPKQMNLTIGDLQGGTSYYLGVRAYTRGGKGPISFINVVTNDNAIGLILAILIPIVVAVLLGILASTICYRKREWIKETFYPEIPNPENSKALQFQKNANEGNKNVKVLEMNPCTPNNVEVLQTVPKVLDTELNSPSTVDLIKLPEDGLETDESHTVISYCPSATNEDTSGVLVDGSGTSSQVVYIDVQSMYQPQANPEDDVENGLDNGGYKPQMQLTINTVKMDSHEPAADLLPEAAGYRPQENLASWPADSPGSPTSMENASFGSPCSVNSRHFLIPPVDDKDSLKLTHAGWSITSLFHNKQEG